MSVRHRQPYQQSLNLNLSLLRRTTLGDVELEIAAAKTATKIRLCSIVCVTSPVFPSHDRFPSHPDSDSIPTLPCFLEPHTNSILSDCILPTCRCFSLVSLTV